MKRSSIIGGTLVLLGVVAVAGFFRGNEGDRAAAQPAQMPLQTVNVSGEGRASAPPDMAVLSLGVSARGATVAEAMDQANQASDRLRASLRANGIEERDIQTSSISISPQYGRPRGDDTPPPIVGYQASQQFQVRVRDIAMAGRVIDDAAAVAGDRFQMSGLRFTFADPTGLQSQAREQAMARARSKAEDLARLGGLSLGAPVAINEGAEPPPPVRVADTREALPTAASAPTTISAGELEVVVTVQVSYSAR